MSAVVRLTLLCHGMTEATSAGRFPTDEPLSDLGARQVHALEGIGPADRVVAGPEVRTRQTAELRGWVPETDAGLADIDYGDWRGRDLSGVDAAELRLWITDPTSAPHGGESLVALIERTADWLDTAGRVPGRMVAVTHPAVIRAAILSVLHAPAESFWRIDVAPASTAKLRHRTGWTLLTP